MNVLYSVPYLFFKTMKNVSTNREKLNVNDNFCNIFPNNIVPLSLDDLFQKFLL